MITDFITDSFDSLSALPLIDVRDVDTRLIRQAIAIHLLGLAGKKKNSNLVFKLTDEEELVAIDSEDFEHGMAYVCFLDNMGTLDIAELSKMLPDRINISTVSVFVSDVNAKYHGIVDEWIDYVYDEVQLRLNETILRY